MKQKCIFCKKQITEFKEIIIDGVCSKFCPYCEYGKNNKNERLIIGYPSEEHISCDCSLEKTLHTTFLNDFSELHCQCVDCREIKFVTKLEPGMCINEVTNSYAI